MIKGLEARARLPRLGVIRLGVKVKNDKGKEYPKEVDHFVIPDPLVSVLGEKPKRIQVLLPSDDPTRVLVADYVRYSGPLLTLKCDGERFTEIPVGGAEIVGRCRKELGKPCPCGAKALARLNVIILDGPMGVYQVLVGGEQRIADLWTELVVFQRTLGRLTEIVFTIERTPAEVQVRKEDGTRLAKTGWPVHIRCDFTAKQALLARGVDLKALPGTPALAAAPEEDEDEGAPDTSEDESAGAVGRISGEPLPSPQERHAPENRRGDTPPPGDTPDPVTATPPGEFDVSLAFKLAKDVLGIESPKAYGLYLLGTYGKSADDVTPAILRVEQALFQKAQANPAERERMKAIVIAAANKAAARAR